MCSKHTSRLLGFCPIVPVNALLNLRCCQDLRSPAWKKHYSGVARWTIARWVLGFWQRHKNRSQIQPNKLAIANAQLTDFNATIERLWRSQRFDLRRKVLCLLPKPRRLLLRPSLRPHNGGKGSW